MRRTSFFIIAVLSIGSALTACKTPKQREGDPNGSANNQKPDNQKPVLLGGTSGSTGHNGLKPEVYHDNKTELEKRMGFPLTSAPKSLEPAFGGILAATDGSTLVNYAISCAVPRYQVTRPAPDGYWDNDSLLTTTDGWIGTPLAAGLPDPNPREDLHTCLATRLNPSGTEVEIWLGGTHVVNDPMTNPGDFLEEAYWTAFEQPSNESVVAINVWPLDTLSKSCPDSVTVGLAAAVNTRVCGTLTGPGKCGLKMRTDIAACTATSTGWKCPRSLGCDCNTGIGCGAANPCQEVIKTMLKCTDWCKFYPGCLVPAGCKDAGSVCPALPPSP